MGREIFVTSRRLIFAVVLFLFYCFVVLFTCFSFFPYFSENKIEKEKIIAKLP